MTEKILRIVFGSLLILIVVVIWVRIPFSNPDMTPQRLLMTHWIEYAIGLTFLFGAYRVLRLDKP